MNDAIKALLGGAAPQAQENPAADAHNAIAAIVMMYGGLLSKSARENESLKMQVKLTGEALKSAQAEVKSLREQLMKLCPPEPAVASADAPKDQGRVAGDER